MTTSILLDCDPGIDDAFAIFCALRYSNLVAITTVSGNAPIEHTTRNAGYIIELAKASVPIHRGAGAPLEVEPAFATDVHGRSGLGGVAVPASARPIDTMPAAAAIEAHLDGSDRIIVATGPLTNIAEALLANPSFAERIAHLYWMGGSMTEGNRTERAEFNAWFDPHAVDVVFKSGVPITMFGLNLTHQVRLSAPHADELDVAGTATSTRAAEFLRFYQRHGVQDERGQPMHDPCAVLGATHPDLFVVEESFSVVDTSGPSRGQTRITDMTHPRTSPLTIAVSADAPRLIELILLASIEPIGCP